MNSIKMETFGIWKISVIFLDHSQKKNGKRVERNQDALKLVSLTELFKPTKSKTKLTLGTKSEIKQ